MDYKKFTSAELDEMFSKACDIIEIIKNKYQDWTAIEEAQAILLLEIRCFREIYDRKMNRENR